MVNKQRPGISKATEFLIKEIGSGKDLHSLPSIRVLAKNAGVSFVTMWKAVKNLSSSIVPPGKRSTDFSEEHRGHKEKKTSESDLSCTGARQNIADRLFKDIVSGRYPAGEKLPSCKELQQYYNISFITLKKALQQLVADNIIEPQSNGYVLPLLTGCSSTARLVAIGCGWEDGKIIVDYQDKNYFRTLESECIRMNLQLDVVVYYRNNDRLQFMNTASHAPYDLTDRTIIGYIFIVANLESTPEEVLERLVGLRRNVAVLDVVGGWKVPRCAQDNRYVQIFTATASVVPAKRIAQYLLTKGHRRIAFFSPFHKALWSQRRLDTIISMFERAGCTDSVVSFVYDTYAYQWDYLKMQQHNEDMRSLIDQYSQWKRDAHDGFFKRFGNLGYSLIKYMTEWNCASGEIFEKMQPFFDRALEDHSITAWVMANDFSATIAIDYLKEKNIRIPNDLSIISFDNTIDAMEYHLTSYDFNTQGIIAMMLRYIIAPHTIKPAVRRGGCIEVDGTLVERRSTLVLRSS